MIPSESNAVIGEFPIKDPDVKQNRSSEQYR